MYKIIDNFLTKEQCDNIVEWSNTQSFKEDNQFFPFQYWAKDLLQTKNKQVTINKPSISPRLGFIDGEFQDDSRINILKDKILQECSLNINQLDEFHMGLYKFNYLSGILLHRDSTETSRRLGITYYLNSNWDENWGGETIIYDSNQNKSNGNIPTDLKPIEVVYPKYNRLIYIEDNWHKVTPNLNKEQGRLSIQTFITINNEVVF